MLKKAPSCDQHQENVTFIIGVAYPLARISLGGERLTYGGFMGMVYPLANEEFGGGGYIF